MRLLSSADNEFVNNAYNQGVIFEPDPSILITLSLLVLTSFIFLFQTVDHVILKSWYGPTAPAILVSTK